MVKTGRKSLASQKFWSLPLHHLLSGILLELRSRATPLIQFPCVFSIACPLASIIYALGFPESLKIHPHHLTCLHLFSLIQCPFFSCLKLHFRILQVTYFVMNMQKAATNFLCQSPFSSKVDGSYQLWR